MKLIKGLWEAFFGGGEVRLFNRARIAGVFKFELWRGGLLVATMLVPNGIVDVGVNKLWDVFFRNQTQIATWYVGLVDNASFSAFANADTMGSHAGWIEVTAYSESVRQTWSPDAASARAVANTTVFQFSINATKTLKGIFVTSDSTKSGTTGTLWSTAAFASTQAVQNGDLVKLTYSLSA